MTRIFTEVFFIVLCSRFGVLLSGSEDYNPFFEDCGPNSTQNINLQSNLNELFSKLKSKAYSSDIGFATTFINGGQPNQINGLIMCYTDSSQDNCLDCIDFSLKNATQICPNSSNATFTYSWCFLRYSNENFIASLSLNQYPNPYWNQNNVSNPRTFIETVSELMNSLRLEAMSSNLLYAYGNKTDPGINQTVYGLVQCTRDLEDHPELCGLCLQTTIGNLSSALTERPSRGARFSSTSCYIRYELDYALPVLNFKPLAPAPGPSPPNMPPSSNATSRGSRTKQVAILVISALGALLFIFVACVCFWRRKQRKKIITGSQEIEISSLECAASGDCRMFVLSDLKSATYNFSEDNKLGEGGFGSVHKGELRDGKIIAVKRLAGWSKQGFLEFKNEVELLAKLKHKNLVKLLGYCLERNEKLLCYEYLPCGSLDVILFATDKKKRENLSWQTRYKIIEGISSGLQYLHIESGFKIIHRDLKPSNILLDEDMTPKIADFGLARLYQDDQTHKETSMIAGTYGYMAPEYAMHGMYSEKLDVYSFGIMLLEIVTGTKNSSFCNNQLASNLISHEMRI
ncbi:cysteine-rich receptor-like protein kinase 8 isoform X2 [Carex rostrata]